MSTIETRGRPGQRPIRARRSGADSLGIKRRSPARASGDSVEERATASGASASVIANAAVRRLTRGDAAAAVGRRILRALDRKGPLTSAEIPRTWPVTRSHIRALLRELAPDGLVATTMAHGCRGYRLTHLGRRCLEEIDWSEAIELESYLPVQFRG